MRLTVGTAVPAPPARHGRRDSAWRIPEPDGLVHLQFRRFAGCPVCNLHLRSFASRHGRG